MSWISTFHGVVTIDAANILRTFKLENVENLSEEIISASSEKIIENKSEYLNSQSSPSLCSRFVKTYIVPTSYLLNLKLKCKFLHFQIFNDDISAALFTKTKFEIL